MCYGYIILDSNKANVIIFRRILCYGDNYKSIFGRNEGKRDNILDENWDIDHRWLHYFGGRVRTLPSPARRASAPSTMCFHTQGFYAGEKTPQNATRLLCIVNTCGCKHSISSWGELTWSGTWLMKKCTPSTHVFYAGRKNSAKHDKTTVYCKYVWMQTHNVSMRGELTAHTACNNYWVRSFSFPWVDFTKS